MTWYHGGVKGLQVDDRILPPEVTGAESFSGLIGISRLDRVYITHSLDDAIVWAGLQSNGGGAVYRVQPLGLREREHAFSEHAPMARITHVEINHVSVEQGRRAQRRIQPELVELLDEDQARGAGVV